MTGWFDDFADNVLGQDPSQGNQGRTQPMPRNHPLYENFANTPGTPEYNQRQQELAQQQHSEGSQSAAAEEARRQQEAAAAAEAERQRLISEEAQRQRDADAARERENRLGAVRRTARAGAESYFRTQGADPMGYSSSIDAEIARLLSGANVMDPGVDARFANVGRDVYSVEQGKARGSASAALRNMFGPDYTNTRVADTLDDQILAAIEGEHRGKAGSYIENLRKRNVINAAGEAAARKNLDEQGAIVRTNLDTIGRDVLTTGRQRLGDIIDRGNLSASTLTLGSQFNPNKVGQDVDSAFNEFLAQMPDLIKSRVTSPLYGTAGIVAASGMGQGPQNLGFEPSLTRGGLSAVSDDDETGGDPFGNAASTKKRSYF